MDELTGLGAMAALLAGVGGSLHCVLMCGPLACAGGAASRRAALAWQGGRLFAYSLLGAALGASGSAAVGTFAQGARPVLPWLMAAGLLATALDLPRRLAPLPGLKRVSGWVLRRSAGFAPEARAGAIGAVTPFLPCGLVYGISLSALTSGSALNGLAVMGAFALGGVPALIAAQAGLAGRQGSVGAFARRAVSFAAAAVLVWRAVAFSSGSHGEGDAATPPHCH
ncbi:MAG: sulfite exporter TauE/SafE family protein [Archangiaceae bacterium]|nr:sulfite exporter TauE/SafE family protein [Archangiaceae bacterium]